MGYLSEALKPEEEVVGKSCFPCRQTRSIQGPGKPGEGGGGEERVAGGSPCAYNVQPCLAGSFLSLRS